MIQKLVIAWMLPFKQNNDINLYHTDFIQSSTEFSPFLHNLSFKADFVYSVWVISRVNNNYLKNVPFGHNCMTEMTFAK